jgi:hypothetical protein
MDRRLSPCPAVPFRAEQPPNAHGLWVLFVEQKRVLRGHAVWGPTLATGGAEILEANRWALASAALAHGRPLVPLRHPPAPGQPINLHYWEKKEIEWKNSVDSLLGSRSPVRIFICLGRKDKRHFTFLHRAEAFKNIEAVVMGCLVAVLLFVDGVGCPHFFFFFFESEVQFLEQLMICQSAGWGKVVICCWLAYLKNLQLSLLSPFS